MMKSFSNTTSITKLIVIFVILIFTLTLVRTAWVSDDAFITFRTIDNFINGHGLVWNLGEKLQTYTNPLWMLFLSIPYFFSHEIYFTSIFLSIILALGTVYCLLFKLQKNIAISLLSGLALLSSQAFIDFSTSGLENVMTNALIVGFVYVFFSNFPSHARKLFLLTFIASLCAVNRLDSLLLFLPALLLMLLSQLNWKSIGASILGTIPLLAWEGFAFFYYGNLLPNTYYAKLHTGIPLSQLLYQGCIYVLDSLTHDPITLFVVALTLVLSVNQLFKSEIRNQKSEFPKQTNFALYTLHLALPLGSLLYVLYVISNGGDFMSGRFFSAPFVLSLAAIQPLLSDIYLRWGKQSANVFNSTPISLIIFIAGAVTIFSAPLSHEPTIYASGITNERDFFFPSNGLINQVRSETIPPHPWAVYGKEQKEIAENIKDKRHVVVFPNVGMLGYFAGPKVYIIDPLGLTDAFLARQPIDLTKPWRVGHYVRELPLGYELTKSENPK